ncbi:MAG: hypothetical protein COY40_04190 [Alphaproteobacteria bacterium CG_4_10_14_0_8_um_filter_53_9]|nr:MAG: hypothetical protein COY40_04190 [Alphaproteobacteria bacterium CG_4_10_14_0_8_um_filter_53_9]
MMKNLLSLTALTVLGASAANAIEWDVMAGGGVLVAPRYMGSKNIKATPLPALSITGKVSEQTEISLNGPEAAVTHRLENSGFSIGAKAAIDFGRDNDEDIMVRGLKDVDAGLEVGPTVSYALTPALTLNTEITQEVAGGHGGLKGRAGVSHVSMLPYRTTLVTSAGLNAANKKAQNTYFGVPANATRADRPAYTAEGGLSHADVSVMALSPLKGSWVLQSLVGADILLADAADSPLSKQNIAPKAMVNLLYRF